MSAQREALAALLTEHWQANYGDGEVWRDDDPRRDYFNEQADAVLAAGFRRDPDAGLRGRVEAVVDAPEWRQSASVAAQILRLKVRVALAEPTPASETAP